MVRVKDHSPNEDSAADVVVTEEPVDTSFPELETIPEEDVEILEEDAKEFNKANPPQTYPQIYIIQEVSTGKVLSTDPPRYVVRNPNSWLWTGCDESTAEGVSVDNVVHPFLNEDRYGPTSEEVPELGEASLVQVIKIPAGHYDARLLRDGEESKENIRAIAADLVDEIVSREERIATLELALCEIVMEIESAKEE